MKFVKQHFFSFLILLFVLFAKGQAQEASQHQYSEGQFFTSAVLSPDQLNAFEKRAAEKVEEFYQYLAVICNPKYDLKLREQAKKQALELFSGSSCKVYGVESGKFLDSCISGKMKTAFEISGKKITRGFQAGGEDKLTYEGKVEFALEPDKTKRVAVIQLNKKIKQFGESSKTIWSVSICEIK
jgi:hypothetical protein